MAISTSAVSLADYALNSNSPTVRAITYSLIDNGSVIQDLPLVTQKSMIANGVRFEGNLPTVSWAALNAEGVTTKGTPTAYSEQVYLIRNYIDVDKIFVEDINAIVDPRAAQVGAYTKSLTYDFNYKFLKNDHGTGDVNAPVGLRYRIDNGATFGVRSENKIDGGAVDLTQAAATQATANKFIELLDQLLWSVNSPEGTGVILYMNEVMKRRFAFVVRLMGTSGGFSIMTDQFGRSIQMYKGAQIRDIGYKQDQSTRIITVTETSTGAADTGSTYTSIYAVNFGTDFFFGWQFSEPNFNDLGLINNGVIYRIAIDWSVGLMNSSTRSIARLYGIKLS
jgi:hypothetical protein